jgi:uncharacterized protein YrrD
MNRSSNVQESRSDFQGNVFVSRESSSMEPRRSNDFIGKPIVSIENGRKLGSVADVMIDRDTLQVAAVATSKGNIFNRSIEAIRAEDIETWGEDVILVRRPDVVLQENQLPGREKWLYVADKIHGRTVVSVDGTRIGQVDDVLIDVHGRITGYELSQVFIEGPLSETRRIPSSATHALGKDVLVINTIEGLERGVDGKQ